jgi:hypothetical protein
MKSMETFFHSSFILAKVNIVQISFVIKLSAFALDTNEHNVLHPLSV